MSKAKELLLECKVKLGVKTDYKLAQALELHRGILSDYMSGKRVPDVYVCMRISLILQRNPAEIIAMIEGESEKNEKRKAFWLDFLLHAKQAAKLGMLLLTFIAALSGVNNKEPQPGFFRKRYFA
jgi:transcriptional regulator with XRE-family HTH domain